MTARPLDVHLNLNVRGLKPSATLAINERCARLRAEGRRVFKLGLGQSPFPVPPCVVAELQANAHQKDYLPVKGLLALREAVAGFQRRLEGGQAEAEDVLIGPGTKELMFILSLVYYGDLVIPTPSWVSYEPQGRIIGRQVHWVPTDPDDGWRLSPAALDALCRVDPGRPRIVILNYPNNPTGATYGAGELEALAAVAREHRVVLLSDEIYGGVHHEGQHVSVSRYYPEGTIVSNGLSKWCGAGGWRLGAFVFPRGLRWLLDAMATVASETYTSTSAPIQYAAVRAFQGGPELEGYLHQSRRVLGALGRWIHQRLEGAGIKTSPPEGGFYLFPDFGGHRHALEASGIRESDDLCERLLEETGVAMLPGTCFGRPAEELTARLAYVDFDGAAALAAAETAAELDEGWLRAHCPDVLEAIDRTCAWVQG